MNGRVSGAAGLMAVAALVAAGCSHNPPQVAATPQPAALQTAPAVAATSDSAARRDSIAAVARADSLATVQAHADSLRAEVAAQAESTSAAAKGAGGLDAADLATVEQRVHFDFDKADLTSEDVATLQQKLQVLQAQPQVTIQIAGNCDERGSEEYNLALGERRAASAKRWLVDHGITDSRVSIISYGKERPLDPAHNEEAWAKNRRDDFVVTGPNS